LRRFFMASDVPAGTTSDPYTLLGGEDGVRRLVERFYDLMEFEPAYATLRAVHGASLGSAREKLFLFLCGWLGGPQHYVARHGHPRLRARHLPFPIGTTERDQWLACMAQALDDTGCPDALKPRLVEAFAQTADWMRNRTG
jgi:hemoglobin